MKNFKNSLTFPLLIMGLFLVFASSCDEIDDNTPSSIKPVFNPNVTYGTMTDQDGNVYKTVTIGTQTWMAENLRTTKYNDGTAIQNVTDNSEWRGLSTGAYCNYNNTNNKDTIAAYGRLYNWHAVNTGKLAPEGWRVPSKEDWETLTDYLGGKSVAGGKLKEIGTTHWESPNTGATNESGFTALPGGYRSYDGTFLDLGSQGCWWSSGTHSYGNHTYPWFSRIDPWNSNVWYDGSGKEYGYSVRCVRD